MLAVSPIVLFAQSVIDDPLSIQDLQEGDQFHGSRILTFTRPTSTATAVPPYWTEVESAAIIDNPLVQSVAIIRFKNGNGVLEYAAAPDGKAMYDSASVLHFRNSGDRSIADFPKAIRLKNDPHQAPFVIACQIVLADDRVIARFAEYRQGILQIGTRSYAIRLYGPSINDSLYSLSPGLSALLI